MGCGVRRHLLWTRISRLDNGLSLRLFRMTFDVRVSISSLLIQVNSKRDGILDDWKEPYHLGRGTGRYSMPLGGAGNVL